MIGKPTNESERTKTSRFGRPLRMNEELRPMLVATVVAFVVVGTLNALRIYFWSYGADSGTFGQIILDAFGSMRDGIENGTHYRFHWSPALVLLWPLVATTHLMLPLQLFQTACTVGVAPLVYALVEPRVGSRVATQAAIVALLYPPLLAMGWGEFHELGLYPPLVLGLIVAADRRAWKIFAIVSVLIVGIREDASIEIAIVAAVLAALGWRSRRAWSMTLLLALGSLAIYYGIVIPRVGSWQPSHFYVYPFASGPLALMTAPFRDPLAFFREFSTFGRFTYLLEAFVPLALLPLLSRWSLFALPGFAIVLLANDALVYHMGNHYAALWSPWLLIGFSFAVARMKSVRWPNAAIAASVLTLVFFDPLHPAHFLKPNYHDLAAARSALACVPHDASVWTHDEWFTQIALQNPNATLGTIDDPTYLVFAQDYPNEFFLREQLPSIEASIRARKYKEICRFGNVVAYKRTGS